VSQENVEAVRQLMALVEQAREADVPLPDTDLITPDAEIDMSRRVFNPAVYRGREGWTRLRDEIREVWEEWRVTPERFFDAGDRVVSLERARARGRGSGVEVEIPRSASIWTLVDGRVRRVEVGWDLEAALKAVGLED
jgi:ketosteroid isomerase-like protein